MADISKVVLPNNSEYNIKDTTARSGLTNKVDKVSGKGLSTNDYTTTEKNKLAGIAEGAEANVQSDWNVTDTSSDAFIKNKPTIPTDTWKAYYGTTSTAAATAEKAVTISADQNFSLRAGTVIGVKFSVSNTAGSVKLNVNSTGAKSIWYNNAVYTGTSTDITGYANRLNYFMYDGTYWVFMTAGNTFNSNTYDRTYLSNNGFKAKSAIVAANIIVAGSDGLYFHLKTGAAFDVTYPILYTGAACNASATNNNGYIIIPFTVTTTQSITLTAYKAVYIKGTLSGTTFTPVSTAPLTQTVPTTDDGYQYILLGRALNSTTLMYLLPEHPIYEYSGGSFHVVAPNADKVNGHTVATDVPANAVFTDTTYTAGTNVQISSSNVISATDTKYTAASENPLMDGTAAVGTSAKYAREDHVHPSDTTKVDKVSGKGLSTNDYTTTEKNKLAGIAAGAEANVQSDWNVTDTSSDAFIKNKPTIPTKTSDLTNNSNFVSDASYVHTDNNYTTTEKNKLSGIATGAEANVQSDWNVTDTSSDAFIKNKPTIPTVPGAATATPIMDGTAAVGSSTKYAKEDHVHPSDTNKVDKVSGKGLSTNDYTTTEKNKLSGIAEGAEVNVQSDWNVTDTSSDAFIKNKPTIPTDTWKSFYGTCTTAAATKDKVVTVSSDQNFSLSVGTIVGVKFSYTNTYSNATASPITLNVNSTGAKNIWYNTTHSGGGNTGAATQIYGTANRYTWYMYDGTYWVWIHYGVVSNSNTVPSAQCETAAATAAKAATCTYFALRANCYLHFNIRYANTSATALTMNVNSTGAKAIYINGTASSTSNYTLPAGSYIAFYNGTYWDFRTDGKLPASITGDAATVNGHTVASDVPANAVFTDTTYSDATTSTAGLMSSSDKTKLNGIATGAEVNVQSDWDETDTTADSYIQNKPTIPSDFPPKSHASTATTYGQGNASNYGHVKLSDTYSSSVSGGDAAGGVAASQNALYNVYANRAPINHASTSTTYGAASNTDYGHVKLSDSMGTQAIGSGYALTPSGLNKVFPYLTIKSVSSTTVPTSKYTNITYVQIPDNSFAIVTIAVRWAPKSGDVRQIVLSEANNNGTPVNASCIRYEISTHSQNFYQQFTAFITRSKTSPSSVVPYYINARQTTGADLACATRVQAIIFDSFLDFRGTGGFG